MHTLNNVPMVPESGLLLTAESSGRNDSHLHEASGLPALTPSQHRVLNAVEGHVAIHGYAPSVRELAEMVDLSSSVTDEKLRALARRGYLRRDPGVDRGLVVLASARGALVIEPKPARKVEHLCDRCRRVMTEPGIAKANPRATAQRKTG